MRTIAIITGTRADWGLLSPIAKALASSGKAIVKIIATNMHFIERYGNTYRQIENDGFNIDYCVRAGNEENLTGADAVHSMSSIMSGIADALTALAPDEIVILGDRYEMLAAASAALIMRIPVVHIAGGAISEGAFDDSIRHAITKMSHIHLTETEEYRHRVIQLGEQPDRVFNTGAIGVWSILSRTPADASEVARRVGLTVDSNTIVVTFHPSTLDSVPALEQCAHLLSALDKRTDIKIVFTYPNNDPYGAGIINLIDKFVATHPHRAVAHASLGQKLYFDTLSLAGAVVGNSSSGIVEAPSFGIPVVDIGMRQQGRTAAECVIHCGVSEAEITDALQKALSTEWRAKAASCSNPYSQPDTLNKMLHAILDTPLQSLTLKRFYNL